MEWVLILGLMIAVVALFGRLKTAENRIADVENAQGDLLYELRLNASASAVIDAATPPVILPRDVGNEAETPAPPPPPRRVSVPSVVIKRIADDSEALAAPTPPAQAEPDAAPAEPAPPAFRIDLEELFGRRVPIWAGGITLAVAGVFLVRYSIEQGLVTPLLRVIMAFVFGFALLAGAEAAYRLREQVADPRVGQALAGAGLATPYAAFYLAGTQYGLIGQTLAFVGLAAVTAGAIALSFRFGLPSAVLGLVGGFAAPLLVGGEEANLPLLALYLGLVTTGLMLSGRRQQRPWMGMTALVGGLGWGAMLLLSGDPGLAEVVALGLYLVVLGAVLPAFAGGAPYERGLRLGSAFVASAQLALLVDQAGYSPLVWSFYLLLAATLAFFGWRRPDLREANAIAATVAIILLAQWDGASGPFFALVAAATAMVFIAVPLALVWRGQDRAIDVWQIAGVSLGLATLTYASFGDYTGDAIQGVLALATIALATPPALAAWRIGVRTDALAFAICVAAGAMLVFAALLMLTPGWAAPLAAAAVFAGLTMALKARADEPSAVLLRSAAVVAAGSLMAHLRIEQEFQHLFGMEQDSLGFIALVRWLAIGAVFAALGWRERGDELRRVAEGAAAFLAYGALAQFLPRDALAWTAALLAVGIWYAQRHRTAAQLTVLALAGLWTLESLGMWLTAALASLGGDPVLVGELPTPSTVALRLLPALAALVLVRLPRSQGKYGTQPTAWLALALALVCGHILFKQLLAIETVDEFVATGLAERTLWEGVLIGGALLLARGLPRLAPQRRAATAVVAMALAHFALYTGLLHNPLWAAQALGSLPLVNLATAAYAVAIGGALLLRRWNPVRWKPALDGVVILLSSLAVLTLLRQAFGGSIPAEVPMGQTEDLLRSLAGILLALCFLWLGSRTGERSWRIGSLAIVLVAVAKVFLIDAAELDGLLRVASFMALGFSLIGIGWVYTRQLRARPAEA